MNKNIEQNVMDKIKKGEVKMKPRSYYMIIGFLSTLAVLMLSFISAYFMSVISLWFRLQAAQGPARGIRNNLFNMLDNFPWWSLVVGVLLLIIIVFLVKKMGSLYKIRLAYLVPSIIMLFLLIGFLLSYSTLPRMFDGGRHNFGRQLINMELNRR